MAAADVEELSRAAAYIERDLDTGPPYELLEYLHRISFRLGSIEALDDFDIVRLVRSLERVIALAKGKNGASTPEVVLGLGSIVEMVVMGFFAAFPLLHDTFELSQAAIAMCMYVGTGLSFATLAVTWIAFRHARGEKREQFEKQREFASKAEALAGEILARLPGKRADAIRFLVSQEQGPFNHPRTLQEKLASPPKPTKGGFARMRYSPLISDGSEGPPTTVPLTTNKLGARIAAPTSPAQASVPGSLPVDAAADSLPDDTTDLTEEARLELKAGR